VGNCQGGSASVSEKQKKTKDQKWPGWADADLLGGEDTGGENTTERKKGFENQKGRKKKEKGSPLVSVQKPSKLDGGGHTKGNRTMIKSRWKS